MTYGIANTSGFSGKNKFDFTVTAYNTLPNDGTANEIAVITETEVSKYVFQSEQPTGSEGLVWLRTGALSASPLWADAAETLRMYPISCSQYIQGAWVEKEAYVYLSGAWIAVGLPFTYLYQYGYENAELIGEVTGQNAFTKEATYIKVRSTSTYRPWLFTTIPISLEGYTTLKATVGGSSTLRLGIGTSQMKQTTYKETSYTGDIAEISCDISAYQHGEYYLNIYGPEYGTFSFYELWLEP